MDSLRAPVAAALAVLSTAACGGSDSPAPGTPATTWTSLVQADWSLDAGVEGYTCARMTVRQDVWVRALRPIAPAGTHHTLFTVGPSSGKPDETFPCTAATIGPNMIFGSGVGTDPIEFPDGVAIRLAAGTELLLNLHLFNVTTAEISGRSGVEVQLVEESDVVHEAEIVLAGKLRDLAVAPGRTQQQGACPMTHDVTVFAVFPHMHQLGVHLRATAEPAAGPSTVLVDAPYDFEDQRYYPVEPSLKLVEGDRVVVDCEYENPTSGTVTFGESSLEEMCFVGLYRYPKAESSSGFICTESGTFGRPVLNGPPCAEAGAPGNEYGVGRHCTEGGGECEGPANLCLQDVTDGDWGNFCTMLCSSDADCAAGATCQGTSTKTCLPDGCERPMIESGT